MAAAQTELERFFELSVDMLCVGGNGASGLTDRVAALGGTLSVVSPDAQGTTLRAEIPAG